MLKHSKNAKIIKLIHDNFDENKDPAGSGTVQCSVPHQTLPSSQFSVNPPTLNIFRKRAQEREPRLEFGEGRPTAAFSWVNKNK